MKRNFFCLILWFLSSIALAAQTYNLTWTKTNVANLPAEISVYATNSTLNGRPFSAWYAIADMSTGNIELRSLLSTSLQTPSQFVSDYGADAYVCTNGGLFTGAISNSVVMDKGNVLSNGIKSVVSSGNTYYPTRGVLGVDKSQQQAQCGWSYSLIGNGSVVDDTPVETAPPYSDRFSGEVLPDASSPCFSGSYYRKAMSSNDYWLGITGTVVLPEIIFDPARINPANSAQYLDNPSLYIGGTANGQETDIGLTWEVVKDANGAVTADRRAFRPFLRRSAYGSQAADYANAPAEAGYYWYPGETVNMSLQVTGNGKLHFSVSGAGKTYETDYDAAGYATSIKMIFKRVNAIDQVNNEGKPAQASKTQILGAQWTACYLYRTDNGNVVQAPMYPGRFTDMRCPQTAFFNVYASPAENAIGGERIDIDAGGGIPWIFPNPSDNADGNAPQPQPNAFFPAGGQAWNAYSAIGGTPLLIKDNQVISLDDMKKETLTSDILSATARTAIGYTAGNKMILFVCDGNQSGSQGATLEELAQLMKELGCTNALNLDGGASSTMIAGGSCLNNPSGGNQRAVLSAVMFTKKNQSISMDMNQLWNYTEASGILPDPNWTAFDNYNTRDVATDGKYVYVPVRNGTLGTGVRVVDANTGQFVKMLSMNGVSGGTFDINSINITPDHKLLVANLVTAATSSNPFKVYMYDLDNMDADPSAVLSTNGSPADPTFNLRFGDKFSFTGSSADGKIMALASAVYNKYYEWDVKNGVVENNAPTVVNLLQADGTAYAAAFGTYASIRSQGTDSLWISGTTSRPVLFVNDKYVETVGNAIKSNICGNTAIPFNFQGKNYLLTVDYDNGNSGAFANLTDITSGISNAVSISRSPDNFGTTVNANGIDGAAVAVYPDGLKLFVACPTEGIAAYAIGSPDFGAGIINPSNPALLTIYPNPAVDRVYFSETVKKATLYSLSGQVIKQVSNANELAVSRLQGLYIMEAVDQSGNMHRSKLIVK